MSIVSKINLLQNPLGRFGSVIVFASTKESVKKLDGELRRAGFAAKAFHSDLEQKVREDILMEFRNKQLTILIGTDILSRGIDVEGISLVVNFNAPHDAEDYVHRIGRTARAATTGTAITFINERDQYKLVNIEALIGKEIPKIALPPELGEAPPYDPNKKFVRDFGKKPFKKGGSSRNTKPAFASKRS